jgi:hypothetical protein
MDHLACPNPEIWEKRKEWFESTLEEAQGEGSYLVSEQACALCAEVQSTYCAGAWVAVIILAVCVMDASLRETEVPGFTGNTKRLLETVCADEDHQQLRELRNAYVHIHPEHPAITVDMQWAERERLEKDAQRAIKLMFDMFFISPSI